MVIKIDRALVRARPEYASFDAENAASSTLHEIDVAKIQVQKLIDMQATDLKVVNAAIEAGLRDLEARGFVLLDAAVAETLLQSPQLFPREWEQLVDSDAPGPAYGNLRFDGTVWKNKALGDRFVVAPFIARGRWGFGWAPRVYGRPLAGVTHFREYTAVLASS